MQIQKPTNIKGHGPGYISWHFPLLGPFMFIMVLESRKRRGQNEERDEEAGESGFDENPTKEELGEGEHDSHKTKQDQTPLWKYVNRSERGKGGGTTKFHCPHCNNDYIGSYTRTRMRKHL